VSGSDFRQITLGGDAPKRERLFRAAVSAFCSLTRPSRRDISQLEDLTLPLFDGVSPESRRYVAAALSECRYPPPNLVKRLCDEPLEVAAPLLIRSTALADIDLLALIGRHGAGHARAIGRRPRLNPTIADLVAVIERKSREAGRQPGKTGAARGGDGTKGVGRPAPDVDSARRRLRSMMLPAEDGAGRRAAAAPSRYLRLRQTALSGHPALFHTALADALRIDYAAIRRLAGTPSSAWLLTALRALDLSEERAFLIVAAITPAEFSGADSIRLFLARYRLLGRDAALDRTKAWQARSDVSRGGADEAGAVRTEASG
jgi:uncharacterized protein (DUF2336 family)